MSESSLDARKNISAVVGESLQKAEEAVANLQKTHSRIVVTTLFSSGAATLIAGITAATGPSAEIGIEGWRTACILAAIFGFVSTVGSGLSQQMKYSERLSEGKQCVGRLRYLNVVGATGSKDMGEISKEYEEIVKEYSEYI